MSGPAAPPDLRARARASGSLVARRALDQPLRRIGIGGAVVLLAVTAAFGGLREQTQDGPEALVVDVPVEVAPFELTVHRVVWTTELPGQYLSDDSNRWVGVVATVRNTSDAGVLGRHAAGGADARRRRRPRAASPVRWSRACGPRRSRSSRTARRSARCSRA